MGREKSLMCVCIAFFCTVSQSVSHTVQSTQHHVSILDTACGCDPSKNEWGVIITWQGLGWAHPESDIYTQSEVLPCSTESGSPQWKTLTERLQKGISSHAMHPLATIVEIQSSSGNNVCNQLTAYLHIYWLSQWISLDMVYFCAFHAQKIVTSPLVNC